MNTSQKSNPIKTLLVLTVFFMLLYFYKREQGFLFAALFIALAGIFSNYLSYKIDFLWMKLAHVLSFIAPAILLSVIFYFVLSPIAFISRITGKKDPLQLKNSEKSLFKNCDKNFPKEEFEKSW